MLAAELKRDEILLREKIARAEANERERTAEARMQQKRREKEEEAMIASFLAPPERIVEFRAKLDRYDTATVNALIENSDALDRVRERLGVMLKQAHTLPDGRRVFKTIDGRQVFDEHGHELSPEVIDPARIDEKKPKWETFSAANDELAQLNRERQQLLDYQSRLDKSRERIDRKEITNGDLDRLERDLQSSMPDAVRQKLTERDLHEAPNAEATNSMSSRGLEASELSDPRRSARSPAPV